MPAAISSSQIAFFWLLHLRWGAVAAQALLVLAGYFFLEIDLPYRIIFAILVFESVTNLAFLLCHRKYPRSAEWCFAPVMFLDITLLTSLLHYSGGPLNPFTFLYLVHITLGAILMRSFWAWSLAGFTTACYAALFYLPVEAGQVQSCHPIPGVTTPINDPMKIHLQGMWLAFTLTAFFIVFFVSRIQRALAQQERTLAELETEKVKNEKLASLATLAAGAAHELSTPLATIAVAAGEMLHTLSEGEVGEPLSELIEDSSLIRDQVERCKDILFQMAADAGEHLGEEFSEFSIDDLVTKILDGFPVALRGRIRISCQADGLRVIMPLRTTKRILRGLIKNGLDASTPDDSIMVRIRVNAHSLIITVTDQGSGMAPEIVAKATEPFFTTKEAGKGLGLGLFLARSAAERLGGGLDIVSEPGKGTSVTIFFSLRQIAAKSAAEPSPLPLHHTGDFSHD